MYVVPPCPRVKYTRHILLLRVNVDSRIESFVFKSPPVPLPNSPTELAEPKQRERLCFRWGALQPFDSLVIVGLWPPLTRIWEA